MSGESAEDHKFWSTQPVPQPGQTVEVQRAGPMDRPKVVADISTDPLPIASTFEWWTPDLMKEADLRAVYELLRDNYVEDSGSMFRFNYTEDFLRWAMTPPGFEPTWHVAARRKEDHVLLGFVSGVPLTMRMGTPPRALQRASNEAAKGQEAGSNEPGDADAAQEDYQEPRRVCEINFLCVKKNLREKGMAPILIQEVTRRVNLTNVWQAVYTAGVHLPTPFSIAQYYHRSLNPEKLVSINFSGMPSQFMRFQNPMTMLKRFLQIPEEPETRGLRLMVKQDVREVMQLLHTNLNAYNVAPVFDEKEVEHYLLPRDGVVKSYVVEREVACDGEGGKKGKTHKRITDFFSYYLLPSTVIGNSKYSSLNGAYVFYYAAVTIPLKQLFSDLLITALKDGADVCNMVDILENGNITEDLKFAKGDGCLHYYFYNWAYPKTKPSEVGLVML